MGEIKKSTLLQAVIVGAYSDIIPADSVRSYLRGVLDALGCSDKEDAVSLYNGCFGEMLEDVE